MPAFARLRSFLPRMFAGVTLCCAAATAVAAFADDARASETVDISYQRSSTLFILLKQSGALEKRLKPMGYDVNWHEFAANLATSMNAGSVDLNADVADAYALFTQAA